MYIPIPLGGYLEIDVVQGSTSCMHWKAMLHFKVGTAVQIEDNLHPAGFTVAGLGTIS